MMRKRRLDGRASVAQHRPCGYVGNQLDVDEETRLQRRKVLSFLPLPLRDLLPDPFCVEDALEELNRAVRSRVFQGLSPEQKLPKIGVFFLRPKISKYLCSFDGRGHLVLGHTAPVKHKEYKVFFDRGIVLGLCVMVGGGGGAGHRARAYES